MGFWNYTGDANPDLMRRIRALGFPVLGASWWKAGNAEGMAKAAAQAGADGMIQTRWSGYFGNTSVWDGMAEQGVTLVRAGAAFWNPDAPPVTNDVQVYRSLYQPQAYAKAAGQLVDLSPAVTRTLKDDSGSGWIQKGASTDLRNLPAGKDVALGDYRFNVSGAVMLRGSRPAARDAGTGHPGPGRKEGRRAGTAAQTGWAGANNREVIGKLDVKYADGSLLSVPLEYGRHLRSWTEVAGTTENLSMIPPPAVGREDRRRTGRERAGAGLDQP
ncbi:glycoside hydrolase, partial [Methylobacterium radiotolerans]